MLKTIAVILVATTLSLPAQAADWGPTRETIYQRCLRGYSAEQAKHKAHKYVPLVRKYAQKHGLPPSVVARVIWHESNYNPNLVSRAGARGLMQVMPFHFKRGQNWRDPATNLNVGCRVLASYYRRFGDWHSALTAYCWGPARVSRGKYRSRYSEAVLR